MKDFAEGFWKATPPGRLVIISMAAAVLSIVLNLARLVWIQHQNSNIHDVIPRLDARIDAMGVFLTWTMGTLVSFGGLLFIASVWAIILYRKQ